MVNVCMLTHSVVTSPLQPMNCSHTGPSIHEALHAILREVNGLPFPTPGDLPDPGMESKSPALEGGFFTTEPQHVTVIRDGTFKEVIKLE